MAIREHILLVKHTDDVHSLESQAPLNLEHVVQNPQNENAA